MPFLPHRRQALEAAANKHFQNMNLRNLAGLQRKNSTLEFLRSFAGEEKVVVRKKIAALNIAKINVLRQQRKKEIEANQAMENLQIIFEGSSGFINVWTKNPELKLFFGSVQKFHAIHGLVPAIRQLSEMTHIPEKRLLRVIARLYKRFKPPLKRSSQGRKRSKPISSDQIDNY